MLILSSMTAVVFADDAELVSRLHADNQSEMKMGKMGKDQAQSSEVKEYSKSLIKDHQTADTKLMKWANQKKMKISREQNFRKESHAMMEDLGKLTGEEFDKEFLKHMTKDHDEALGMLDDYKNKIQSPWLKEYVSEITPKLQSHKDIAQRLFDRFDERRTPAGDEIRSVHGDETQE